MFVLSNMTMTSSLVIKVRSVLIVVTVFVG